MPHLLKRLIVSFLFWIGFCLIWAGVSALIAYRRISQGLATGFGFVLVPDVVLVLLLLAFLAFWLSARFVTR